MHGLTYCTVLYTLNEILLTGLVEHDADAIPTSSPCSTSTMNVCIQILQFVMLMVYTVCLCACACMCCVCVYARVCVCVCVLVAIPSHTYQTVYRHTFGGSHCTTRSTSGMSRPLAATSVATKQRNFPSLKLYNHIIENMPLSTKIITHYTTDTCIHFIKQST